MRDHLGKPHATRRLTRRAAGAWLAGAGVVLLLALAIDRAVRVPDRSARNAAAAGLLFPLAKPERSPVDLEAPASGLLGETEAEGGLGFDEFMDYLNEVAQDPSVSPAAKEFVEGFERQPELRRVLRDFQRASAEGKKPTANRFVATLRREPAFRQLAAKLLEASRSASVFAAGKYPELADLAKAYAEARGASAVEPGGRAPAGKVPTFEEARRLALESAAAGGLAPQSPGPALGPENAGGGPRVVDLGGGGPSFASPGGAPGSLEGRRGTSVTPADAKGGGVGGSPSRVKDVKRIQPPPKGAKLLKLYPFLGKYFSPDELARLEADVERSGLWGACFENGWFARCADACRDGKAADGRIVCSVPDGWSACMKDLKDAPRCVELCLSQAPCVPDRDVLAKLCYVPQPPAFCDPGPRRPDFDPWFRPRARSVCKQEAFGLCCFDEWGSLVFAEGNWPPDKRQCEGELGLSKGVCRRVTSGVCCWDEDTSRILYRNHDRACDGKGAAPCDAPLCCRKVRGERCCFHGRDGVLVEGSPSCLETAPSPPPGGEEEKRGG